jgi:hypothetical protein
MQPLGGGKKQPGSAFPGKTSIAWQRPMNLSNAASPELSMGSQ